MHRFLWTIPHNRFHSARASTCKTCWLWNLNILYFTFCLADAFNGHNFGIFHLTLYGFLQLCGFKCLLGEQLLFADTLIILMHLLVKLRYVSQMNIIRSWHLCMVHVSRMLLCKTFISISPILNPTCYQPYPILNPTYYQPILNPSKNHTLPILRLY